MRDAGRLVLVATPIGNLGDLSPRAIEALAGADLICCEDTRRTGTLLKHAGVSGSRLAVCNEHTEGDRIGDVLAVLGRGGTVAVVSDAGTPGISDPGERLVRAVADAGFDVSSVPGPTAFAAALVTSGLPTSRFVFEGFIPRSGATRRARLAEIGAERRTVLLYEAPHRIERTLADLLAVCGPERPVVVARELTKLFETVVRGSLATIDIGAPRGEYVIVLGGAPADAEPAGASDVDAAIDELLATGLSTKEAAAAVASRLNVSRRDAYAAAVAKRNARRSDKNGPE
jgi:16S rRNA (cytidine1402-2'-O)-methyltransferase